MSQAREVKEPSNHAENLKKELLNFVTQAAAGAVIGPLRMGMQVDTDSTKLFAAMYFKDCWHSFHKKNDAFVVNHLNAMLSHNIIKGCACLLTWLQKLCNLTIDRFFASTVVVPLLSSLEETRTVTHAVMRDACSKVLNDLDLNSLTCTAGTCKDEHDVFVFLSRSDT